MGTFKEALFLEVFRRSQMERFAFARILTRLVSAIAPVEEVEQIVGLALSEYGEELFQLRYNSRYESVALRKMRERLRLDTEYNRILQKVDELTVSDEELKGQDG